MKLQQQQLPRHAPHLLLPSHPLTTGHVFGEKHCTFALDGKLVTELHGQRATAGGEIQQREGSASHLILQVWGRRWERGWYQDRQNKPTGCGVSETSSKTATCCCQLKSWHLLSWQKRQDCMQFMASPVHPLLAASINGFLFYCSLHCPHPYYFRLRDENGGDEKTSARGKNAAAGERNAKQTPDKQVNAVASTSYKVCSMLSLHIMPSIFMPIFSG